MATSIEESKSEEISMLTNQKNWNKKISLLYKKEIMSDCVFVICKGEEKTRIPAHKFILSASSEEFFNLFYLMECDSNEIFLDDFSIQIFDKLLTFIYKNTCIFIMDEIWDLFRISSLYGVHKMSEMCVDFIGENITEQNVFIVFEKANTFNVPNVDEMCLNFINKMTIEIFKNPNFLEVELHTIRKILQFESLSGEEINIYRAVNLWVENKLRINKIPISSENKRNLLGELIKNIRFASMTDTEFNECTDDPNSLLTKEEVIEIFKCIAVKGKRPCSFSDKQRDQYVVPKMCKRIPDEPEAENCCGADIDLIQFSTNKDIIFCGVGLFGRAKDSNEQLGDELYKCEKVSFSLQDSCKKTLVAKEMNIFYNGTDKLYEVFFKKEILLKKNIVYNLYIKRDGPCGIFWGGNCTDGLVEHDGVQFNFCTVDIGDEDWNTAGIIYKNTIYN